VLNDSNHGPMVMERGAIAGEEMHLHFYLILLILSLFFHIDLSLSLHVEPQTRKREDVFNYLLREWRHRKGVRSCP
jgi:hypothetical protein